MRAPAVDRCVAACLVLICEAALLPALVLETGRSAVVDRAVERQVSVAPAAPQWERFSPPIVYPLTRGPKRPLTPEAPHFYEVQLRKGEALRAAFSQEDVDIAIEVFTPQGKRRLRVDRMGSAAGREDLVVAAEVSGLYRLKVLCSKQLSLEGKYQILEIRRGPVQKRDRTWVRAADAYAAGTAAMKDKKADPRRIEEDLATADRLWARVGYLPGQADANAKRADFLEEHSAKDRAIRYNRLASDLYRKAGRKLQEAGSLSHVGVNLEQLSKFAAAVPWFRRASALAREETKAGAKSAPASQVRLQAAQSVFVKALVGQGLCQVLSEDFLQGQQVLGEALGLARELQLRKEEGLALYGLGLAFFLEGDQETAAGLERDALSVLNEAKEGGRALDVVRQSLGDIYLHAGVPERAVALYDVSLERYRLSGDRHAEGAVLNSLSTALYRLKKYDESLEAARRAETILSDLQDFVGDAESWANQGWSLFRLEQEADAQAAFDRALTVLKQGGNARVEAHVLYGLANLARSGGDLETAQRTVERVLAIIDRLAANAASARERSLFLAEMRDPFDFWVEVLMQRDLLEPGAGWSSRGFAVSDDALGRGLREAFAADRRPLAPGTGANGAAREERRRLRLLDPGTVLLEYYLTENGGFLWIATRGGVRSVRLPSRSDIQPRISELYAALRRSDQPGGPERAWALAADLAQILLGPAMEEIARSKTILVVLPRDLEYLPFPLLPAPQPGPQAGNEAGWPTPLAGTHEVVEIPSLSAIDALRQRRVSLAPPTRLLAIVDDPVTDEQDDRLPGHARPAGAADSGALPTPSSLRRLPYSSVEGSSLVALAGRHRVLRATGFAARREIVRSKVLGAYRLLHFATHGVLLRGNPEGASLVLSRFDRQGRPVTGYVSVQDIQGLRLRSDLVVLSACSSGVGEPIWGAGFSGLSQAFIRAGASRVLVSLWEADDEATAELMRRFYEGLLRQRLSPAAALRAAQESIRTEDRWRSPFYWGGFVLKGDWR